MTNRHTMGMAFWLITTCAWAADPVSLPERYVKALRGHDLPALKQLFAEDARITVVWADEGAAQRFSLNKADFLQQYRAVWRFGTQESVESSAIRRIDSNDPDHPRLGLRLTERRILFGKSAGQRSELLLRLRRDGADYRIEALEAAVSLW